MPFGESAAFIKPRGLHLCGVKSHRLHCSNFGVTKSMKRLRILIVEDDAMIALLLDDVLREMGHEVCASEAGEAAAIRAARRCKPDLMIVDEHLGEGSGMAVVDEVLGVEAVPHLFVSGDARRITALRPDSIVVEKPFSEVGLARAIQRAMEREVAASSREHANPVVGRAPQRRLRLPTPGRRKEPIDPCPVQASWGRRE